MMSKPASASIINILNTFAITNLDQELISKTLSNLSGDLVNDSRLVIQGDIFCAIVGHAQDGRRYINKAITQGAKLVLAECEYAEQHGEISFVDNISVISFYQLNLQLFSLSSAYYQNPQSKMTMIGVTGTNGKTTTSQLIAQMLTAYSKACGVIGTNGAGPINQLLPIENTTPSASELHQLFYRFEQEQLSHVAMEVSSHALVQGRVTGDLFDVAVFTNLSRDHLDYHGTMLGYAKAKKALFTGEEKQIAIFNFNDEQVKYWLAEDVKAGLSIKQHWFYGLDKSVLTCEKFVCAQKVKHHHQGVSFTLMTHIGEVFIESPLLGDFNIENLLAAISVLLTQGVALKDLPSLTKKIHAVAGRMEATTGLSLPTAVVDYAHTPDALEKALTACRQHCQGELYVVFGCGGDRDKGKRPLMAKVAQQYADYIVITNDNPRTEIAEQIVEDILAGFTKKKSLEHKIKVQLDREQAVLDTLIKASQQDIVLLAGKGHEDYVIFPDGQGGTKKVAYDERAVVSKFYHLKHETQL